MRLLGRALAARDITKIAIEDACWLRLSDATAERDCRSPIGDRRPLRTDTEVVSTAHNWAVSTGFGEPARFRSSVRMLRFGGGTMVATGSKKQIGVRGEDLACAELERQGMRVLERNWRCRLGEIDIVAAEAGERGVTLVFCEVKCRSGLGFGHPLEAITYTKMRTLRQLAAVWMREHRMQASSIRVDAIGVVLQPGLEPSLTHVRAVG